MKKKIIIPIILIIIILNFVLINTSLAQISAAQVQLFSLGSYFGMLQYDGQDVIVEHVVYDYNGVFYPAYSLDKLEDSINTNNSYAVNVQACNHLSAWEILYWSYPYRTPEELGCYTEVEAYIATEIATECILKIKDINGLVAMNEEGQRILNAVNQIVNVVCTTQTDKPIFDTYCVWDNINWDIDKNNSDYMSKTYSTIYNYCDYERLTPRLFGNIPEGTIITDIYNQEKQAFSKDEKFKILIPKSSLKDSGSFVIDLLIENITYAVLEGVSENANQRKYILSTDKLEDGIFTLTDIYPEYNPDKYSKIKTGDDSNVVVDTEANFPPASIPAVDPIADPIPKEDSVVAPTPAEINKNIVDIINNINVNTEKVSLEPLVDYINKLNLQIEGLKARVITQEELIKKSTKNDNTKKESSENINKEVSENVDDKDTEKKPLENLTQEKNIIQQKESTELTNVPKLPRTGY